LLSSGLVGRRCFIQLPRLFETARILRGINKAF
jgi:hypothetical protein